MHSGSKHMYVVVVRFEIHPHRLDAFMGLMTKNARESLNRESGCRQFDIVSDSQSPEHILLYEIYNDRESFDEHLHSPHFIAFSADTADMVKDKQVQTFDRVLR